MTAVLVMQCRDDGLLDLDDPIKRFVPETGYASATVRSLLAHVSGMQSEPVGPWWERSPGIPVEDLLAANDGSRSVFGPGEHYHYSNLGYALLGEAVARLRGQPWFSLVQERVLGPLGMTRTSYLPEAPYATGLSVHHLEGTLTEEPLHDTGSMAPAGQLWSTLDDVARFAAFLAGGDPAVLADRTLAEMRQPVPPAVDYGLGIRLVPYADGVLAGHTGSMPGFQSVVFADPLSKTGRGRADQRDHRVLRSRAGARAARRPHAGGDQAVGAHHGGACVGARAARLLALGQLGLRGPLERRAAGVARPGPRRGRRAVR